MEIFPSSGPAPARSKDVTRRCLANCSRIDGQSDWSAPKSWLGAMERGGGSAKRAIKPRVGPDQGTSDLPVDIETVDLQVAIFFDGQADRSADMGAGRGEIGG